MLIYHRLELVTVTCLRPAAARKVSTVCLVNSRLTVTGTSRLRQELFSTFLVRVNLIPNLQKRCTSL